MSDELISGDEPPHRFAAPHFEAYIAPARRRPAFWRILVGLLLILLCFIGWQVILLVAITLPKLLRAGGDTTAVNDFLNSVMTLSTPTGVFIALAAFAGTWGGVALAAWALHKRGFRTLFAAPGRPLFRGFGTGIAVALAATVLSAVISWPTGADPVRSTITIAEWLPLVAILLPLVLIQTGAEELVFRGYLLQQLAARWSHPLIWGVLPSFLFGAMHWWNVDEGWLASALYVTTTACFGFAAAAMVWKSGSLAPAFGFHAMNNLLGFSIFGIEDSYDGLSLFIVPKGDLATGLALDTTVMALVALLAISRWSPFRPARARSE